VLPPDWVCFHNGALNRFFQTFENSKCI
jgi:hypothetical protein